MLIIPQKNLWKGYLALAVIFCVIVSVNFTKPFGFFRESNPALVAINANYWKENPDIRKQHIPVASYSFNKSLPPGSQLENTITTFGYGWFSAPYYFLQITGLPIGPVGLRIFSLCWLLFTVFAIYKLTSRLTQASPASKTITIITIALYVLSPVIMWYQVNGYVHETAVLPFYYLSWYFFLRLLQEKKAKWLWLTALFLFVGIQFDWLSFFQGVVMSAYLLFSRKENLPKWMFLIPGSAIALGIIYILYNYMSWASAKDYLEFMRWKFGSRTVGEKGTSYISALPANLNILLFYVLGYGILLCWSVIGLIKKKFYPLIWLLVITAVLHYIVFWGFSSEHDYAALKMALPIAFWAALLIQEMNRKTAWVSMGVIIVFAASQYFFLHNYPYRKGIYTDEKFFSKAGYAIKKYPKDMLLFVNTDGKYFPQVEFYAGRPYKIASSLEDAKQKLREISKTDSARYIVIPNAPREIMQSWLLKAEVSDTTKAK